MPLPPTTVTASNTSSTASNGAQTNGQGPTLSDGSYGDNRYGRKSLPSPAVHGNSNNNVTNTNTNGTYRWKMQIPFDGHSPVVTLRNAYRISPNTIGTFSETPGLNALTHKAVLEVPVAQFVATGGSGTTVTTTDFGTMVASDYVNATLPYTLTVVSASAAVGSGQFRDVTANGTGSFTVATFGNSYVPAAGDVFVLCRRVPITFGGVRTVVVQPGIEIPSDPIPAELTAALGCWIRLYYIKASGESYPTGYASNPSLGEGGTEGSETPTYTHDFVDTGSYDFGTFMLSGPYPNSFEVTPNDNRLSVDIYGDSRTEGFYDMGGADNARPRGGYSRAMMAAGVAGHVYGNSSEMGMRASAPTRRTLRTRGTKRTSRRALWTYGTNDFSTRTAAQMIADAVAWANSMVAIGVEPWIATLPPLPSSNNGFKDAAGQTVSGSDSVRVAFNVAARAKPTPFVGVVDEALYNEDQANPGKWVSPGGVLFTQANASGVSSAAATNQAFATLTDTNAALTPNQYQYKVVYISGGTGVGQMRGIVTHSATVLQVAPTWTTALDSTSTWQIIDSQTAEGTHESKKGHDAKIQAAIASGIFNI